MSTQRYVVGLAFSEDLSKVAMIRKESGPPAVIGKWNGVGGKVEPTENSVDAMTREFREETGVFIPPFQWADCATIDFGYCIVTFYCTRTNKVHDVRTVEKEQVLLWDVDALLREPDLMHNLRWLIPYLTDQNLLDPMPGRDLGWLAGA